MADGQGNILTISTRERFKYENTLVCLLQALSGRKTTVELRNETCIEGKIVHVDGFMNTEMSRVVVEDRFGRRQTFHKFHVQGRRIRFVHIPSDVDIGKAIESQMTSLHRRRHHVDKQSKIGTKKNSKAEEKMKAGMKRGDEDEEGRRENAKATIETEAVKMKVGMKRRDEAAAEGRRENAEATIETEAVKMKAGMKRRDEVAGGRRENTKATIETEAVKMKTGMKRRDEAAEGRRENAEAEAGVEVKTEAVTKENKAAKRSSSAKTGIVAAGRSSSKASETGTVAARRISFKSSGTGTAATRSSTKSSKSVAKSTARTDS